MRSLRLSLVLYLLLATQQTIAGPLKLAGRGSGPSNTTSTIGEDATPTEIEGHGAGNRTSTRPAASTPHPQYQTLMGASIDIPESMLTETLLEKAARPKTVVLIPIDETTSTRPANRTRTTSTPDAFPTIPSLNTTSTLHLNSSHRTSERATSTSAAAQITSLETQAPTRPAHNSTLTVPGMRTRNSTVIVTSHPASSTSESSLERSSTATTTEPAIFVPPVPTLPANQTRLANHTSHATTPSKPKSPTSITSTSSISTTTTMTTTTSSVTRTEPYYMTSDIPSPITVANPKGTLAPQDVYQHNLDQARRFNTLYGSLAAGSLCSAGQVACIDGKIATCPATGAQFALAACGWSNLRCFVMPLNHTEGVVIGCNDVAEAGGILAPPKSSSTTSILPFLTTGIKTTAPAMTTTTTTATTTSTIAKNTASTKPTAVTRTSVVFISDPDLPPATGLEHTPRPTMTPKSSNSTTVHIPAAELTSSSTLSAISLSHNSTTTAAPLPKTTGILLRPIPDDLDPLASGLLRKVIATPERTVSLFFTMTVTNEHYVTVTATPGA